MSHARTVPDDSDVIVTATFPLVHRCPHVEEVDEGSVTIAWRVEGETYELHSLREYLDGFKDAELSHEQITSRICHDLSVVPRISIIEVITAWSTAGGTVEVRA